jgi:hypothetical protein
VVDVDQTYRITLGFILSVPLARDLLGHAIQDFVQCPISIAIAEDAVDQRREEHKRSKEKDGFETHLALLSVTYAARRFLVLAAFLADLERSDAGRLADAAPPNRPPFLDGE